MHCTRKDVYMLTQGKFSSRASEQRCMHMFDRNLEFVPQSTLYRLLLALSDITIGATLALLHSTPFPPFHYPHHISLRRLLFVFACTDFKAWCASATSDILELTCKFWRGWVLGRKGLFQRSCTSRLIALRCQRRICSKHVLKLLEIDLPSLLSCPC